MIDGKNMKKYLNRIILLIRLFNKIIMYLK
jgi:hypothetical protein